MLNVLNNPRPHSPTGEIAGENSKGMCQGGKPGTGKLYVYVAPHTPVGAWSMALGLQQLIEYKRLFLPQV